jgi:hypothetical protein
LIDFFSPVVIVPTVTVLRCTFQSNSAENAVGGGIFIDYQYNNVKAGAYSITIKDSKFIDNYSKEGGGAIAIYAQQSSIINCTFIGNSVGFYPTLIFPSNGGGAVLVSSKPLYLDAFAGFIPYVSMEHYVELSYFAGNEAPYGGAILSESLVNLDIKSTSIIDNKAIKDGGGLLISGQKRSTAAAVEDVNFMNNNATERGGAVMIFLCNVIVSNSMSTNNSATLGGGWMMDRSTVNMINVNMSYNSAHKVEVTGSLVQDIIPFIGNGGGMAMYSSDVDFTGMIVSNIAEGDGGGAYVVTSSLVTRTSSILNNTAMGNYGGGLALAPPGSILSIKHSLFSGNVASLMGGAVWASQATRVDFGDTFLVANHVIMPSSSSSSINRGTGSGGGGAIALINSVGSIQRGACSNNTSDYDGGAILLIGGKFESNGQVDCGFNLATRGGGGCFFAISAQVPYSSMVMFANEAAYGVEVATPPSQIIWRENYQVPAYFAAPAILNNDINRTEQVPGTTITPSLVAVVVDAYGQLVNVDSMTYVTVNDDTHVSGASSTRAVNGYITLSDLVTEQSPLSSIKFALSTITSLTDTPIMSSNITIYSTTCTYGMYFDATSGSCRACSKGQYTTQIGATSCEICPSNSRSLDGSNGDGYGCVCKSGYVMITINATLSCIPCLSGFSCDDENVTQSQIVVSPGYWNDM